MAKKNKTKNYSAETRQFAREYGNIVGWKYITKNRIKIYIQEAEKDALDRGYKRRGKQSQEAFIEDLAEESLKLIAPPSLPDLEDDEDALKTLENFEFSNLVDFAISDIANMAEQDSNFGIFELYDEAGNTLYAGDSKSDLYDAIREYIDDFSVYVIIDTYAYYNSTGQMNLVLQIVETQARTKK